MKEQKAPNGYLYPELKNIHQQIKQRTILDGEIIIIKDGKPDFAEIQRRALLSNKSRINFAVAQLPVTFTAFDIIYSNGQQLTDLTLMQRKEILQSQITENDRLAVSRYIEKDGIAFYNLTEKEELKE